MSQRLFDDEVRARMVANGLLFVRSEDRCLWNTRGTVAGQHRSRDTGSNRNIVPFKDMQHVCCQPGAQVRITKDGRHANQFDLWRAQSKGEGQGIIDVIPNISIEQHEEFLALELACAQTLLEW